MQETDVGRCLGDGLAIELQDEPQNAVRGRVRRPHVEDHFFADVAEIFARARIGRGHARHRVRRFDFARDKCHRQPRVYAGERRATLRPVGGGSQSRSPRLDRTYETDTTYWATIATPRRRMGLPPPELRDLAASSCGKRRLTNLPQLRPKRPRLWEGICFGGLGFF